MNGGDGEGRAVGGRSGVSYGAAGAVNNSWAKGPVVANETKQGSNARPRDVYVSPLFSALNSVWHSRPRSEKGTKNVFKPSENVCGSALLQIQNQASERTTPLRTSSADLHARLRVDKT